MGAIYMWECGECGRTAETSGPWEFYRDRSGKRRTFGHPVPISTEAAVAGISGLAAHLLCSSCGHLSDSILVEFVKPTRDTVGLWMGVDEPLPKYKTGRLPYCHKCGSRALILDPPEDGIACPWCSRGRLRGKMGLIT